MISLSEILNETIVVMIDNCDGFVVSGLLEDFITHLPDYSFMYWDGEL